MENIEISKEKVMKIPEGVLFALLLVWMILPIIQTIRAVYSIIPLSDWYFGFMRIVGIVGIGASAFVIYDKIKNSENKKETVKELLPIFIFVLYMGWTLISCYLSPNKYAAFNGTFYRKEGYYMYINYAGFFLCAFLLKNEKLKKILLNTFIISSIFLIIMSRMSLKIEALTKIFVNNSVDTTVFAQFNHYGYYLMMTSICALGLFITEKNKILKVIYLVAYTLISYALIYNNTFGCYLASAIFLILYSVYALIKKTDRRLIMVAITIFIILSCNVTKWGANVAYRNINEFVSDIKTIISKVINVEPDINEEKQNIDSEVKTEAELEIDKKFEEVGTSRMALWINGIKFVKNRPIIGYGPDNLREEYASISISQDRPHNLFIYLASVSGIPGMLIYITAVGIIVVKGIKKLFKSNKQGTVYLIIVITYLISSMFGNSMFYTTPYFFIFLGSLMSCNLFKLKE